MRIINVRQNTPEWLEERKGRITGSTAKTAIFDTYKSDAGKVKNLTLDFWQLLADRLKDQSIDEATSPDPEVRGHELEDLNASITIDDLNASLMGKGLEPLKVDMEPGLWVSGDSEYIAVSPDVCEDSDKPTWAIECKSLASARHLSVVVPWILHEQGSDGVWESPWGTFTFPLPDDPLDYVPNDYQDQCLQYFVVDPDLQVLYFSLYDPSITDSRLAHVYITITRASIHDRIDEQRMKLNRTLGLVDHLESKFPIQL